jgi:hypothetical protein
VSDQAPSMPSTAKSTTVGSCRARRCWERPRSGSGPEEGRGRVRRRRARLHDPAQTMHGRSVRGSLHRVHDRPRLRFLGTAFAAISDRVGGCGPRVTGEGADRARRESPPP